MGTAIPELSPQIYPKIKQDNSKYNLQKTPNLLEENSVLKHGRVDKKIGRNTPCPCGSGKKYKKCHSD